MRSARKRHVQVELQFSKRGGKRKGAGRPPKGKRSSERHKTRPQVRASEPVHVTLRVTKEVGYLRRRDVYDAVRRALQVTFPRENFRIVHTSIQGSHLHLLVEADNKTALAAGMKGFEISAAKHLNNAMGRSGTVFPDRYNAKIIKTRRGTRHALSYVLNNWRRHREDNTRETREWRIDPYSSASSFDGWKDSDRLTPLAPADRALLVSAPRSWLLREGWKLHGLIRTDEVPGPLRH